MRSHIGKKDGENEVKRPDDFDRHGMAIRPLLKTFSLRETTSLKN
jgi:hypothetical protein